MVFHLVILEVLVVVEVDQEIVEVVQVQVVQETLLQ
tara:strand:+ start:318 stop:425 length:108 start_codon:yes stop_codon:yes gene_type:complete